MRKQTERQYLTNNSLPMFLFAANTEMIPPVGINNSPKAMENTKLEKNTIRHQ